MKRVEDYMAPNVGQFQLMDLVETQLETMILDTQIWLRWWTRITVYCKDLKETSPRLFQVTSTKFRKASYDELNDKFEHNMVEDEDKVEDDSFGDSTTRI